MSVAGPSFLASVQVRRPGRGRIGRSGAIWKPDLRARTSLAA